MSDEFVKKSDFDSYKDKMGDFKKETRERLVNLEKSDERHQVLLEQIIEQNKSMSNKMWAIMLLIIGAVVTMIFSGGV